MVLEQIAPSSSADEVARPLGSLNEALGRLLEDADAHESGLGLDEGEPVLVFDGAPSNLRVQSMYQRSPTPREAASGWLSSSLSSMALRHVAAEMRADSSRGS